LLDEYFRWKYTAPNRYATTTAVLKRFVDENGLGHLDQLRSRLLTLDTTDVRSALRVACQIPGLGTAGASGLLALMYPRDFGTVDQFVVNALRQVDGLPEAQAIIKTAKALGIDIPPSLLARAGNVIDEPGGCRLLAQMRSDAAFSVCPVSAANRTWIEHAPTSQKCHFQTSTSDRLSCLSDDPVQPPEYRRVFAAMVEQRAEALIVSDFAANFTYRQLIVELAEANRLPAIYPYREHAELGGLMAYATDTHDLFRQAANQVDRILRGEKPGEIPYYQASIFVLIINMRTAKALGITVPPSILARADEVIE
jgi:hypothetical protein